MVNNQGIVIYKSRYKKGKGRGRRRIHDYGIYKKDRPITLKDVLNVFDLGYLEVEKDFPEQPSVLPFKNKRNQELSQKEAEKEYNQSH